MTPARQWSLRLRDVAALFAFLSMAISGELPNWISAFFLFSISAGLANYRLLARFGKISLALLALAGAGLYGAVARGHLDLVIAASGFATLLIAQRLLSEATSQTDDQILLISLLMISGGASLSGELLFVACLAAFGICASVSRGLALMDEVSGDEPVPMRPVVRQLFRGSLAALLGAAVFFVVFPRLSWNVATRTGRGLGAATSGFSNGIRLGGSGELKTNPRPVFRAKLFPDPQTATLDKYWVGKTLEVFDGRAWVGVGDAERPRDQVVLSERFKGKTVRQELEILPAFGGSTIPMLERPLAAGPATAHSKKGSHKVALTRVKDVEVRAAREATAYSVTVISTLADGRASAALPEGALERFAALPPKLDPRIAVLAREVVGDAKDPHSAAEKLQRYLISNYRYTLELDGDVDDPLAHFLFVRKAGHCEYFATALAVMLRTLGIGSRVATGFYGGERVDDHYVLRAGDAHAWTQVLLPELGFVSIDATPADFRGGKPAPFLSALLSVYEKVDNWWRRSVLEFSIFDQAEIAKTIIMPRSSGRAPGSSGSNRRILWSVLAGVGVVLVVMRVLKALPSPAHEATALLALVERNLVRHKALGVGKQPTEVILRSWERDKHPAAAPTGRVYRRYLEARFGNRPLVTGERRQLAKSLRRNVEK